MRAEPPPVHGPGRLREMIACLDDGRLPPGDIRRWFVDAVQAALADPCGRPLGRQLGIDPARYAVPWWRTEAKQKRARLVNELRDLRYPDYSRHAAANEIAADASRFASDIWPKVSDLDAAPANWEGLPRAILFELHRCGATWPLKWRAINELLGG